MNNTYGITIESFLYDISLESIIEEYTALEAEVGTVLNNDGSEVKSVSKVPKFLQKIGELFKDLSKFIYNLLVKIGKWIKEHVETFTKSRAKYMAPSKWVNAFYKMLSSIDEACKTMDITSVYDINDIITGLMAIKRGPRGGGMFNNDFHYIIDTAVIKFILESKGEIDGYYNQFCSYDILRTMSESDINETIKNYNGSTAEFDWKKSIHSIKTIESLLQNSYKRINTIISSGALDHINITNIDDDTTVQEMPKIIRAVFNWEMQTTTLFQKEVNRLYLYTNVLTNKKFKV